MSEQARSDVPDQTPVHGATPESWNDAKVKSMKGVTGTMRLPDGVAVIADTLPHALAAATSMPVLGERSAEAESFVPDCLASSGVGPVDVHAHIFNGTDLQVERFLSRVVAPSLPAPSSATVSWAMAVASCLGVRSSFKVQRGTRGALHFEL